MFQNMLHLFPCQMCHAKPFLLVSTFWNMQVPCYFCAMGYLSRESFSLLSQLDATFLWSIRFALGMVMGSLFCCEQFYFLVSRFLFQASIECYRQVIGRY